MDPVQVVVLAAAGLAAGFINTLAGSGVKGFLDGPGASARFSQPTGIDVKGGIVYVADAGNNRIRMIATGTVTTLAGSGASGNTSTCMCLGMVT